MALWIRAEQEPVTLFSIDHLFKVGEPLREQVVTAIFTLALTSLRVQEDQRVPWQVVEVFRLTCRWSASSVFIEASTNNSGYVCLLK